LHKLSSGTLILLEGRQDIWARPSRGLSMACGPTTATDATILSVTAREVAIAAVKIGNVDINAIEIIQMYQIYSGNSGSKIFWST
jgi:hypothetical protein